MFSGKRSRDAETSVHSRAFWQEHQQRVTIGLVAGIGKIAIDNLDSEFRSGFENAAQKTSRLLLTWASRRCGAISARPYL